MLFAQDIEWIRFLARYKLELKVENHSLLISGRVQRGFARSRTLKQGTAGGSMALKTTAKSPALNIGNPVIAD
jgi:hypothetical protein